MIVLNQTSSLFLDYKMYSNKSALHVNEVALGLKEELDV